MMRVFAALILNMIFIQYMTILLVLHIDFITTKVVFPWMNKHTYIEKIEGDSVDIAHAMESLEKFNKMGDGKIITYESPKKGWFKRGIIIEIRDFNGFLEDGLAGWATAYASPCRIAIKKTPDPIQFEQVLIHEYLHCMGYLTHSNNRNDVMYHAYRPVDNDNLLKYAQELKEQY